LYHLPFYGSKCSNHYTGYIIRDLTIIIKSIIVILIKRLFDFIEDLYFMEFLKHPAEVSQWRIIVLHLDKTVFRVIYGVVGLL
jgi:hypothetical protein